MRKTTRKNRWMLLALVLLLCLPAWSSPRAEETPDYTEFSLEDLMEMSVVYGASKHRQKAKEAPSSITIITREDIQTYGYRTMAEVLASLRGFTVTYDRNYYYVGVRGLGEPGDLSSRILVLVDGIRTNEGSVGGVMMGNGFPVDLDLIERIEVIRGPASSLYGTNAVLGIINVVTREGYKLNGFEVQPGISSFGGRSLRFTGGYETATGVDMLVSGSVGKIDGQDHYIDVPDGTWHTDGTFEDGDKEEWNNFLAKVLYKGFNLEALYGWRLKHNPMAPGYVLFNDNSAKTQDTSWSLGLGYKRELPWEVDLSTQLVYQHFKWDGEWPYEFDFEGNWTDFVVPYVDDFRGQKLTGTIDMTKYLPGDHVVAVGAEYVDHKQMDMSGRDLTPYYLWYDFKQDPENWGVYALSVIKLRQGLLLNVGLRHDEYTTFGGSTNPRFAIVTEPRKGTVFKALYGTAFRAPNGYEISSEEAQGHLDYTPEEIETYELIWEQELGKGFSAALTGYMYDYRLLNDEEFDQSDLAPEEWVNDEIESSGIEFELVKQAKHDVKGRFSYSYNKTEEKWFNPVYGNSRSAPHMVKMNVSAPGRGLVDRLGFELQYYSKRLTIAREWADYHFLVNLNALNTSLADGLEIRASIYNLLNEPVPHPATRGEWQDLIWQDGRSFRLYMTLSH